MRSSPISRKRATTLLAVGAYLNTSVLIVQGLLLVPLYLHFIGISLYGLWLASGGVLGMLSLMNFGISSMMIQRVANAYGQQNFTEAGKYFINGMLVYTFIAFLFSIVGIILSPLLPWLFDVPTENRTILIDCFRIAVVATGIGILNECLRGFAQALLRPALSVFASIIIRIFGILVSVFLLYRGVGLWALPIAMLLTESLLFIVGVVQAIALFHNLHARVSINKIIIKEYFDVGGSLLMARLGHVMSRESDPILITMLLRPEITAAYMVTRRAADIVSQLLSVMNGATHGAFSHLAGQGNQAKTSRIAFKFLSVIFFAGLIGFTVYIAENRSFTKLWVGESLVLDQEIILLIGIAFFAHSLRNLALQILNGLGDFVFSSKVILVESIARIIIGASLLRVIGVVGLPISLIVAGLVSTIVLGLKVNVTLQWKLDKFDLIKALTLVVVLYGLAELWSRFVSQDENWITFGLNGIAILTIAMATCTSAYWNQVRHFRLRSMFNL